MKRDTCKRCHDVQEHLLKQEKHWEGIYRRLNVFWSKPGIRMAKRVAELERELELIRQRQKR